MPGPITSKPEPVLFTKKQCEYLTKMFPDLVLGANATEGELKFYMGQRSVLLAVKERVQTRE